MNLGVKLGDYATTPLYNIKAVVQVTEISPSTLRAWKDDTMFARRNVQLVVTAYIQTAMWR